MDIADPHERWNDHSLPVSTTTVPELFAAAARATPDAIALVDGGRRLTYRELAERVAQLAHRLLESGLSTEGVVALCMPRSAEMVVAVLASMVAGGAFVPVDPEWPQARRDQVMADAGATVALIAEGGPRAATAESIVVSLDDWRFADRSPALPRPVIAGSQLAYVIFTSGSTGTPKGAMIRHEAICERLQWQRDHVLMFGPGDASLFKAPLAFDISINEILLPLVSGGRVVVAAPGVEKDPDLLLDLIRAEGVTYLYLVSSMLDAMLALDLERTRQGASALTTVTHIWCGGEVLTPGLFDRFRQQLSTTLYHGYGPAEATIGVSHVIYRDSAERIATSIGRPNPHTQLYVLDDTLAPVPVGVGGELYAAGFLLGRGYVGRPALTAAAFVANPFDPDGARMYRTGDLARWTEDGTLEFLGRADNQVKIGGRRVELEEIEATLSRHGSVRQAVVTMTKSRSGTNVLSAYLTEIVGSPIDRDELRGWAAANLPDYMVPTTFTLLERFPVNVNGKVDRRALPDPSEPGSSACWAAPRSPQEVAACGAFAQVLGLPQVGVDDDFYALGGDSITAVKLVLELRRAGYTVRARDIATRRTPGLLAAELSTSPTVPAETRQSGQPRVELGEGEAAELAAKDPALRAVLPLTSVQAGICFHSVSLPEGTHDPYIVQQVVDLIGPLDTERLQKATHAVVERHDALAAGFHVTRSGRLVSTVGAAPAPEFRSFQLTGATAADDFVARITQEERERGFDLSRPPLMRYALISLDAEHHRLVQTVHHIIADGWSVALIWDDILAAYRGDAFSSAAPQLPRFLDWWAHGRDHVAELAAWKEYLVGIDEPVLLADHLDHRVEAGIGFGRRTRQLSETRRRALTAYARARSVSESAVLTAAWGLTIGAVTARTDVVFGSTTAGRDEDVDGIERIVGMLLNTVATRVRWSSHDTFDQIVARFVAAETSILDHQHIPLVDVHSALGVPELFDSLFSIENLQRPQTDGGDVHLGAIEYLQAPHYRLTAMVTLHESVSVAVTNDRADIDDAIADRIADAYLVIVGLIVAAGDAQTAPAHPALTALDRVWRPASSTSAVDVWARGDSEAVPETTVDALLRDQARRTPRAVAVVDDESGSQLTYAELDARANAVAQVFVDAGVRVGDRVGVVLPRSADVIAVLTGVLRAGAAYVPIDPLYPSPRVAQILEDAGPALVVTDEASKDAHAGTLAAAGTQILTTGEVALRAALDDGCAEPPALGRPLAARDLVCVIFTSGTTGRPKGVELSHQALSGRLEWGRRQLDLGPTSVGLVKSGVGFVDAATELFGPLIVGASVVVLSERIARDPDALAAAVRRHTATHLLTVPSLADAIAGADDASAALRSLRSWVCSGEVLLSATAEAIGRVAPDAALHNFYGSTEVTGDASLARVAADDRSVTIGSPVPNTTTRVLDEWLRPVPPGVVGELYVGGAHLADAYAGHPALSAERFVADPFSDRGGRLYRTGDLVRWNDRGRLEYVGRSDHQIKIRGMRIELEEVRRVLAEHPAVSEAVVVTVDRGSGGKQIAAYVTAISDGVALADALRVHLSARLPEYMIPWAIMRLDAFPVTANGKLDRRALPMPDLAATTGGPGRAPETAAEITLTEIFRDVLAVGGDGALGVDDDFFRLGGDSILSIRVVRQARSRGLDLTIQDVFALRTPARLAAGRVIGTASSAVADVPASADAAPVTPTVNQHRLRLSGMPIEDCFYTEAVDLSRATTTVRLEDAVAKLVRANEWLRQRVTPSHRLLWTLDVDPFTDDQASASASVHDFSESTASHAVRALRARVVEGIDVTAGRPLHAAYAASAEGHHLVVGVHGLAADRRHLHRLVEAFANVLDGDGPDHASVASVSASTTLLTELAHSAESQSALNEWADRLLDSGDAGRSPDAASDSDISVALRTLSVDGANDNPVAAGEIEAAFLAAVSRWSRPGRPVDLEWDLRPLLGADPDPVDTAGSLTTVYPRFAGEEPEPEIAYAPWFDLWRYVNKASRKRLRRAPSPDILLTQVFGRQPDPAHREGFESLYSVVARYAMTADGVELQIRGDAASAALLDHWGEAIDTRHLTAVAAAR